MRFPCFHSLKLFTAAQLQGYPWPTATLPLGNDKVDVAQRQIECKDAFYSKTCNWQASTVLWYLCPCMVIGICQNEWRTLAQMENHTQYPPLIILLFEFYQPLAEGGRWKAEKHFIEKVRIFYRTQPSFLSVSLCVRNNAQEAFHADIGTK